MTLDDHFAERLAEAGWKLGDKDSVAKAAASLGKTPAWGKARVKAMVAALGEQAE